jgi:predicted O-methyltransferase YrrM
MSYRKSVSRIPGLRALSVFLYRGTIVCRRSLATSAALVRWWLTSHETTNFTYDLTVLNKAHLAALVADITGTSYSDIVKYIAELDQDSELRTHVRTVMHTRGDQRVINRDVQFGRRLGWYAFARAIKPKTIVETGVDKGLGSCVLTAALAKNAQEGYPGHYYGFDINPKAGYLLAGKYAGFGEIRYGDSLASLRQLDTDIDLFINDSDHSPDYETAEYHAVAARLTPNAIVLGDNSHATDSLLAFSLATERQFAFFRETPDKHWYPGAGIGIAFRRGRPLVNERQDRLAH